jgi:hypothetical protein
VKNDLKKKKKESKESGLEINWPRVERVMR